MRPCFMAYDGNVAQAWLTLLLFRCGRTQSLHEHTSLLTENMHSEIVRPWGSVSYLLLNLLLVHRLHETNHPKSHLKLSPKSSEKREFKRWPTDVTLPEIFASGKVSLVIFKVSIGVDFFMEENEQFIQRLIILMVSNEFNVYRC